MSPRAFISIAASALAPPIFQASMEMKGMKQMYMELENKEGVLRGLEHAKQRYLEAVRGQNISDPFAPANIDRFVAAAKQSQLPSTTSELATSMFSTPRSNFPQAALLQIRRRLALYPILSAMLVQTTSMEVNKRQRQSRDCHGRSRKIHLRLGNRRRSGTNFVGIRKLPNHRLGTLCASNSKHLRRRLGIRRHRKRNYWLTMHLSTLR